MSSKTTDALIYGHDREIDKQELYQFFFIFQFTLVVILQMLLCRQQWDQKVIFFITIYLILCLFEREASSSCTLSIIRESLDGYCFRVEQFISRRACNSMQQIYRAAIKTREYTYILCLCVWDKYVKNNSGGPKNLLVLVEEHRIIFWEIHICIKFCTRAF